jgi:hypothetical protein
MPSPVTVPKVQTQNKDVNQLQNNIINALQSLGQQLNTNTESITNLSNTVNTGYFPDVKMGFGTEAQFQSVYGMDWVLCDGRYVGGSTYANFTGSNFIPDMRATVPRMKDNGRGLDPHGDLALGTYEADQFASHTHGPAVGSAFYMYGVSDGYLAGGGGAGIAGSTAASGGSETNAKSTIINFFVRIN